MIDEMQPDQSHGSSTRSRLDSGSGSSKGGSGRFRNFLSRPKAPAVVVDATASTTAATSAQASRNTDATIDQTSESKGCRNKPTHVMRASSSSALSTSTTTRLLRKAANDFDDNPTITASPGNTPPMKIWEGAYHKFLRSGGGGEGSQSGGNKPDAPPASSSPSSNASLARPSSPPDHSVPPGKKSSFSLIPGTKRLVTSSRTNLLSLGVAAPQQQEPHLPSTPEGQSATMDVAHGPAVPPFPSLRISPRSSSSNRHHQYHNNHVVPNGNPTSTTTDRGEDTSVRGGSLFKAVFSRGASAGNTCKASSTAELDESVRGRHHYQSRHKSHQSMDALDIPMRKGIEKSSSASPEYHRHIQRSVLASMPPPLPGVLTGSASASWAINATTPRTTVHELVVASALDSISDERQQRPVDAVEQPNDTSTLDELLASASAAPTIQQQHLDWISTTTASKNQQRSISMGGLIHPMIIEGAAMVELGPSPSSVTSLQPRGQKDQQQQHHLSYGSSGHDPSDYQTEHQQQTCYTSAHQKLHSDPNNNEWNRHMRGIPQSNSVFPTPSLTEPHHQVGLNMDDSENSNTYADGIMEQQHQEFQQQQLQRLQEQESLLSPTDVRDRGAPVTGIVEDSLQRDPSSSATSTTSSILAQQLRYNHHHEVPPPPPPPSAIKKAFTNFHNASQFAQDSASAYLGAESNSSRLDLIGAVDSYVSYHAMLMRPGGFGNSVPYGLGALSERNLPVDASFLGCQSLPLDTVDEQNISIHKGMRLLKPIQGTESWQQGRRYLIVPAALASCPLPVMNKLSGSAVYSAMDAASATDTNEDYGHSPTSRSCFGMIDLGEVLMTYVGEKHHLSLGKWSSCRLVLRQNYLFEYDLANAATGLPRGFCHLEYATAYPHKDFADALELNFYASPCAKADQRVLMIRAQNRKERDHLITCLNQAAKLKIDDLWDYDETRPFGTGRYANVFPARRKTDLSFQNENIDRKDRERLSDSQSLDTNENPLKSYHTCALKIVNKNEFWRRVVKGRERADTLVRELAVQATLTAKCTSMPTFLQLRGFFETSDSVVLELEILEGIDLFEHMSSEGVLAEEAAGRIIRDVLVCLDAMNRVGLAHRDIKPANILMSSGKDGTTVKVGDFGMSTFVGVDGLVRGRCGTPGYVAPEILSAGTRCGYSNQADIFSAGVTLYVMLAGYEPFYGETEKELIEANRQAKIDFPESDWGRVSSEARDLVEGMLKVDCNDRITAREALRHPWLLRFEKERKVTSESTRIKSDFSGRKSHIETEDKEAICNLM